MRKYFNYSAVILFAFSVASCTPQLQPISPSIAEPVLPQADFATEPSLKDEKLKTQISFRKQENQNITFTVGLQTLSKVGNEVFFEDAGKLLAQGQSASISSSATLSKASTIRLNTDLKDYKFPKPDTKKVRLKITMAQAKGNPETWQQAKSRIVFSKWLDYK